MLVRVLGTVEVLDPTGSARRLPAGHATTTLLALAVAGGRPVAPDRLADVLWGEAPPPSAGNAVQVYVRRLRRHLGDGAVLTGPDGYALAPAVRTDLAEAERLVADAAASRRRGDHGAAADLLGTALELWRGPLGGTHGEAPWLLGERARVETLREQCVLERAEALVRGGRGADALPDALGLGAAHPLDERVQALLVTALAAAGRREDALAAHRKATTALRDELGLEPGPLLRAAHDEALHGRGPAPRPTGRVPAPVHPLLGRDADLDAVCALLAGPARLVTVTGPGGVGKTRFAVETAQRLADRSGTPPVWVPLSELTDPAAVPAALASALGLWDTGPQTLDAVVEHLRREPALVVLDNFEHVLAAAAAVDRLLTDAPGARVLVTSRSVLHVHGEHQYRLAPLASDASGRGPAPDLLLARAAAVRPGLVDDARVREAAARVCRALDGLPLALELAAARAAVLPLAVIADQLEAAPADLAAPDGTVGGPRHRSLRTLVGWSADLLPPDARRLLARLSVFRGGCTLDAVAAVADHDGAFGGRVLDLVERLRDASLVDVTDPAQPGATARLHVLVMVREHAAELLADDERAALARAHGGYYARVLDGATRGLPVHLPSTAAARTLLPEADNLRAALAAARDAGDAAALADLAGPFAALVEVGGSAPEALTWLTAAREAAIRTPDAVPAARRCDVHLWLSRLARDTGGVVACLDHARTAVAAAREAGDPDREAMATMLLAYWLAWFGDKDGAARLERVVGARIDAGAVRFPGMMRGLLGLVAVIRADHPVAERDLRRGLAACTASGEDLQALVLAGMLAESLVLYGRAAEALDLLSRYDLGDLAALAPRAVVYPLTNRVVAALAVGDRDRAAADLPPAVRLADRSGDVVLRLELLRVVAAVAAQAGDWEAVVTLLAGFGAHAPALGGDMEGASASLVVRGLMDAAQRHLGAARAEGVRLAGAQAGLPQLWDVARRAVREHVR